MVRKLLTPEAAPTDLAPALVRPHQLTATLTPEQLTSRLRLKRSNTYVEAMAKLYAGGHTHNRQAVEAFVRAIAEEFPGSVSVAR